MSHSRKRANWRVAKLHAVLTAGIVMICFSAASAKPTVTVLAAISLREALPEIARDFEASHDAAVDIVFGASGQLVAQIEGGAPADVFISAANEQVDRLARQKLVDTESRRVVARNTLVLVVPADAKQPIRGFEQLGSPSIERLAIGDPKSVPAGLYAMEVLEHLKLRDAVAKKLLLGANVKQVLDYVARGEADAGIVYGTDVSAAGDSVRLVAVAREAWHAPIEYPAIVVTASRSKELADAFIKTLGGDLAQATLNRHGFTEPATQPAR